METNSEVQPVSPLKNEEQQKKDLTLVVVVGLIVTVFVLAILIVTYIAQSR
jgi:hypothetical protein